MIRTEEHMEIIVMVSVVSVIGVVFIATATYLIDKNANRRDPPKDH